MKKKTNLDSDRAILGIRSILSKHRCSLSNPEIEILEECISLLEEIKSAKDQKSIALLEKYSKVAELILKVFTNDHILKFLQDLFS